MYILVFFVSTHLISNMCASISKVHVQQGVYSVVVNYLSLISEYYTF